MTTPTIPGRLLTIEEAVALKEATDPRASPDGRLVAFCVGAVSKEEEHARGAGVAQSIEGLDHAPLRRLVARLAQQAY